MKACCTLALVDDGGVSDRRPAELCAGDDFTQAGQTDPLALPPPPAIVGIP
jgi:hypothetical protein